MELFRPANYKLAFEPDLRTFRFKGSARIRFKALGATGSIELDAAELKVTSCHVVFEGRILRPKSVKIDGKNEKMAILLREKIKGDAELVISFTGILNDKLAGFYRSRYRDANGKGKYLATTQFEADDARRAFPCWDEPDKKATFDITLVAGKGMTAISNMPAVSVGKRGNKKIFTFARTPVMSTYLVYLGVGEFEHIQSRLGKTVIRVLTTRGKKERGRLALGFARKFLGFFERYFGIKYPLPKLDLIAIPDFASGAMENWGAITFREVTLLFDPRTSSTLTKQTIAEVVSHELVHQWFGNLVTMEWWDDIWLNESFATFMAYKAIHEFYPGWDMWSQFLDQETVNALALDSLKSSHPICTKVETPTEIREIFDEISYEKGGSVLRMLESYVGEEDFRAGLHRFLDRHRYSNAARDSLWEALEGVSKKPIRRMMENWIKIQGYPLVEARVKGSKIELRQRRFLLEPKADSRTWLIPVSMLVNGRKRMDTMLKERRKTIDVKEDVRELKLNLNQSAFFRAKYPKGLLEALRESVRGKSLGNLDRWGVQDDLFFLSVAGEVPVRDYLDFLKSFSSEDDYLVLKDIADNISTLHMLAFHDGFPEIVELNRRFFKRVFDRLGWEPRRGEKHTDKILRSYAISSLGRLGDGRIVETANEKFWSFLKNPSSLGPDLRGAVFSIIAWNGGMRAFRQLQDLYKKSMDQEEKRRLLGALASFKEPGMLRKTLDFSLTKEVRSQDLPLPVARVSMNPCGRDVIWPWIRKNWGGLRKRYAGGSLKLLERVVDSLGSLSDMEKEREIKTFFKDKSKAGIEMALRQSLERIRINAMFLNRLKEEFHRNE